MSKNHSVDDECLAEDYGQQRILSRASPPYQPPPNPPIDPQVLVQKAQCYTAQNNFTAQLNDDSNLVQEICAQDPDRWNAYQQAQKECWKYSHNEYQLSDQALSVLQCNGFDTKKLKSCYGNAVQQQLHQEVVRGIEATTELDAYSDEYGHAMCQEGMRMFDGACQANALGDVRSTVRLIDLGKSLVRFLFGRLQTGDAEIIFNADLEFCKGFVKQVPHTLQSLGHMVMHPIESIKNIGTALLHIGRELRNYVPIPPIGLSTYDCEHYAQRCDAAAQQWAEAHHALVKAWNETPADAACQAVGGFAADCIVSHCCLSVAGKAATFAAQEVVSGATRTAAELATLDAAAPGYLLIQSIQEVEVLTQVAQQCALTEKILHEGLQTLEVVNPGCTTKLARVLQEHAHIQGISEQVMTTIEQAACPNQLAQAVRVSDRLEHVLNLAVAGEEIVGYGCQIVEHSPIVFDCVTANKAIKYAENTLPSIKNMKLLESSRNNTLLNFQKSLLKQQELALQAGKVFEIHFSGIIEREWAEWLAQEQIAYDFVHKIKLENFSRSLGVSGFITKTGDKLLIDLMSGGLVDSTINLEHIFLPDCRWFSNGSCRLSGLHYDYMGLFEQSGILKMTPIEAGDVSGGFYAMKVSYAQGKKKSTFFPKHWSRERVLEEIRESLRNKVTKVDPTKNGKFWIISNLQEGVELRALYNPELNAVETCFPNLFDITR